MPPSSSPPRTRMRNGRASKFARWRGFERHGQCARVDSLKATKILLAVSGVIALLVSFGLMFAARPFMASQGLVVDDKIAVIAQAQGSLLFAVGVFNFFGLRMKEASGLQGLCAGNVAA